MNVELSKEFGKRMCSNSVYDVAYSRAYNILKGTMTKERFEQIKNSAEWEMTLMGIRFAIHNDPIKEFLHFRKGDFEIYGEIFNYRTLPTWEAYPDAAVDECGIMLVNGCVVKENPETGEPTEEKILE